MFMYVIYIHIYGNKNDTSKVVCMYIYHMHSIYILHVYVCDICTYILQQKGYDQGSMYVYNVCLCM